MVLIKRIDYDHKDYDVSDKTSIKTVKNTLNNYPWFSVKYNYNNHIYVKKDTQWYYRTVCEDWSLFIPHNPDNNILDAYNNLIKKEEIKNFTTNSILIQDLLIPDVMNYLKQFI
jgi:hypothetical protein